jgi:Domain of unknown function (DUF4037)
MVGRTAERGDEFGSRLLSARVAGDPMWLAFALSGQWPPYAKWRGMAFQALPVAADLAGPLTAAATATGWRGRESVWVPTMPSPHATCEYSWIRPPSRSRLRTRMVSSAGATGILPSGGLWLRARCGRWVL